MLPLPLPERGGSIEVLRSFLNLPDQNDFVLVVTWLLAALRPSGPYPLLAISGEQGSTKTVLSKMLRALVDPNAAPVRALPRDERSCSSQQITVTCWHSTTSRACDPGSLTRFAGWRAAAVLPRANSTPIRTRCCSMPRGRSFSMALRTS